MSDEVVHLMLNSVQNDYIFMVDFYKLDRGLSDNKNKIRTSELKCWKIVDSQLEEVQSSLAGIFFDNETYIIKWAFEFKENNEVLKENMFFFWKGQHATKGYSPLPAKFENEQTIVERIVQWSEPPAFLRLFPEKIITIMGSRFNSNVPHLFMFRGELQEEIHLYEVPCKKSSLRSKISFLLIDPVANVFVYWHGNSTLQLYENIETHLAFKNILVGFDQYSVLNVKERHENDIFVKTVEGSMNDYSSLLNSSPFSPKLFYFNIITGQFLATLVEYSAFSKDTVAPFPFLHSHLYTALPPATFLIDNYNEIWLWADSKRNDDEFETSKNISVLYTKEVKNLRNLNTITLKYVVAGHEPLEFINIFPYWVQNKIHSKEKADIISVED